MVHIDFTQTEDRRQDARLRYNITPSVERILKLWASGLTDKAVAAKTNSTLSAVHMTKARLRVRMGEPSNISMLVRLVKEGLI